MRQTNNGAIYYCVACLCRYTASLSCRIYFGIYLDLFFILFSFLWSWNKFRMTALQFSEDAPRRCHAEFISASIYYYCISFAFIISCSVYQLIAKSVISLFCVLIRFIFHVICQFFNCFSLSIAVFIFPNSSK